MPVLETKTKKIILPSTKGSDDEAWVKIDLDMPAGVIISSISAKTDEDRILSIITKAIVDWNFTDKAGKKAPITQENVAKIGGKDFVEIMNAFDMSKFNFDKAKKKTS